MPHVPFGPLAQRILSAALLSAGLFVVTPPPQAQSLTAPAGQARVTAPGGLRGRAAMRKPYRRGRMMPARRF
ncbi:MAG TPA: hypothetical protein VF641_05130 [Methylobacterium sp.]|jgi:hypothetical protein